MPEVQDGAGMRQASNRNQNGWSRGWAHCREEAGTGIQTKSYHTHGADCERIRGPPRSGVRKKHFQKELEEKESKREV